MTATFARRLDALYAFARRVAGEDGAPALVEALDAVLTATPARACLAFGVDGALDPVAERGLLVRAGVDAQVVKRALYRLASHAATTRRALVLGDTRLETHVPEAVDLLRGNFADVERRVIGLDHMVVGKRLAERWQLPSTIRDCIWLHGQLPAALPATVKNPQLVNLITLADTLVREQHLGYSGNYSFSVPIQTLLFVARWC